MLSKVKSLTLQGQTTKNDLLMILQEDAKKVNLPDIICSSLQIRKESDCIHTSYREDCIKAYTKFILRIMEVKGDGLHYNGQVDMEKLNTAISLLVEHEKRLDDLEDLEPAFWRIFKNLSLYTTFIKDEPIHQVGTPFPGGFKVKKEGNKFTCPVKKNNQDNPLAVCPFCIAEQDEDV